MAQLVRDDMRLLHKVILQLVVALMLPAIVSFSAQAQTITSVSPSSGSSAGGTTITITGTDFNLISGTPRISIGSGGGAGLRGT
jgi:hypothetical protein